MSIVVKTDPSGAVTLPAEVCLTAGVPPGSELVAEVQSGRIILEPATREGREKIGDAAEPRRPSLAERIVARARALPSETLDRLPTDGAAQHDHYIYGTPKRSG